MHDDEVETGDKLGKPPLFAITCFGLEPIDKINDIDEPAPRYGADQARASAIDR